MLLDKSFTLPVADIFVSKNKQIVRCFEELKSLLYPLYQYKQGNCHNVVHYASELLTLQEIEHKKIWIYAPCRYSSNARTAIKRLDPNQLSATGILSWGYHVALWIAQGGSEYIFDFFIDEENPLTLNEWELRMNVRNPLIEIVDPQFYLFYTQPTENKKKNIFNGQYFEYEGLCCKENWLPKGLAINETAMQFSHNELGILKSETPLGEAYRQFVGSVNNFECILRDNTTNKKMTQTFKAQHIEIIEKYRKFYEGNIEKWITKWELLQFTGVFSGVAFSHA